jgi:Flp pilus assembly protein TadD
MLDPGKKCYAALFFDDEKEYDEYISAASKLIALKPDHHIALNNRGVAFVELGRWPEAEQDFRAACAAKWSEVLPLRNLASLLERQGNYEEALAFASRAISLDQGDHGSFALRASIYRQMQREEEAVEDDDTSKRLRELG